MNKKCLGCGSILQNNDINKEGYVLNIDDNLCNRCFRIKYYNEYKKVNKNNNDYLEVINSITKDDLVIYVTSILDIRLDYIDSFKNVIVVLTKRDIIPKSVKDSKIINYMEKRYNYLDIEVISSLKNYNLDSLYNKIIKHNTNGKVYIIGNTNSGKSTLINKLIKNYGNNDIEITSSMYPSTTLDKIEIELDKFKIIDTPGLINEGSIINYVDNKMIKKINCTKEIKPKTYQIKGKGSIIIENLIRIDYETQDNSMTLYINNGLNISFASSKNNKLQDKNKIYFNLDKHKDIVISDLCFIKFVKEIQLTIYSQDKLSIYERDNLI